MLALAALALLGAACSDNGPVAELDDGSDSARTERAAPEFPSEGEVPRDLLAEGLVYDLSNRPADLAFWAAPGDEAECAAGAIIDAVGEQRLSGLGYRPGTPGASLGDLDLLDDERTRVADAVQGCLDMTEAVSSMFYGDGRLAPSVASCLAEGLTEAGQLRPFVVGVVFGQPVDPFANGGALASALLSQSTVCVPDGAFNWSQLDLPEGPAVIDADSPGGVPGSPFVDDQTDTTAPSTTAPSTSTTGNP